MSLKEKIKKLPKRVSDFFNGKKTWIGIISHAAWLGFNIYKKDIGSSLHINGHYYIGTITATGGIHKILKFIGTFKRK